MVRRRSDPDLSTVGSRTRQGGPRIRRLIEQDLTEVMVIEEASFATPWSRSIFANLLRRPTACLFSAVDGRERIVGYAAVWFVGDEGELGDLAVDPRARRTGVGSLLVQAVFEEGRGRAIRRLFLAVRESNVSAQSLYRRHGFEIAGHRPGYYTNPVEGAVLMQSFLIR